MRKPSIQQRPSRLLRAGIACIVALGLSAALLEADSGEPDTAADRPARLLLTEPTLAAQHATDNGGEVIHLRWKLSGFLGFIAGLFVPNSGDALLTFVPVPDDRIEIQFLVTASKREGEYYLYGAQVDERSGSPLTIWNSENIRGKRKDRETSIDDPLTIDYASAIYRLRWHGTDRASRMTIWDRGRAYAAEIEPLKTTERKISGTRMQVRAYVISGAKGGENETFDDKIWLYFAQDGCSTPVEIVGKRGLIRARIELIGVEGVARPPSAQAARADCQ